MMSREYRVTEKIWRWPGAGGWHFVTIDKQIFAEIRASFGKGMVPVTVTLMEHVYNATLFPETKTETYLLAIKKKWRRELDLFEGDTIPLSFIIKKDIKQTAT